MSSRGLRVLVIEDNPFQQWLAGNLAEAAGAACVVRADDGAVALELVRANEAPMDVILTDIDMPNMDGLEFLRRLAETGTSASIVITSALERPLLSAAENMARSYGLSVIGALAKPLTPAKLKEALSRHDPGGPIHAGARTAPAFSPQEVLQAIAGNRIEPLFQPVVCAQSGRPSAARVVPLWNHERIGPLGAHEFLPAAGTPEVRKRLLAALLRGSFQAWASWKRIGFDIALSVNLPREVACRTMLAEELDRIATAERLPPASIKLRLEASALASSDGRVLECVARLRLHGFRIAIDGYGRLAEPLPPLEGVPAAAVIVDAGLVRRAADDFEARARLLQCREAAARAGIEAGADGVDTRAEWDLVRRAGFETASGGFVGAPLAAGRFLAWASRATS